jgi:hypothetical protein
VARVVRKKGDVDLNQLKVDMAEIGSKELRVGWFESAKYDEGTPVAYVASIQEFGTASGGIPPRPFMRPTIAENRGDWIKNFDEGVTRVLAGILTMEDFLNILGLRIAGQVRKSISTVQEPPLSPITLALRKQKLAGAKIGGALVGATAAAIAKGETGPGELGDSSGINTKPLVFDGFMMQSVTHEVSD